MPKTTTKPLNSPTTTEQLIDFLRQEKSREIFRTQMNPELRRYLDIQAADRQMTLPNFLEMALVEWIQSKGDQQYRIVPASPNS